MNAYKIFAILRHKRFFLFMSLAPEASLMDLAKQLEIGNDVLMLDTVMIFARTYLQSLCSKFMF